MTNPCSLRRAALLALVFGSSWPGLLVAQAQAQTERYELGRRLRDFEVAWNLANPDAAAKKRTLPHLQRAVSAFFTLRTSEVARALVEAKTALRGDAPPKEAELWAASLAVIPARSLLDLGAQSLSATLRSAFALESERPEKLRIVVELREDGTNDPIAWVEHVPAELPHRLQLDLSGKKLREAEHWLDLRVFVGDEVLARSSSRVSIVAKLAERLATLNVPTPGEGAGSRSTANANTDSETLKMLARLLSGMAAGKPQETDFAALGLLADAERIVEAHRSGKPWFGTDLRGDHLVWLRSSERTLPIRCFVPVGLKTPAPLVIAFHGAGGSENMFFDAYGAGAIVEQCRKLGWILVTPRGGLPNAAAVVSELTRCLPADPKRIYLVGHSMGAANAAAAAPQIQGVAGVALLGGGGAIRGDWTRIPTFLGAGSADFGLPGVRGSRLALERQEAPRLVFREYLDIEHLAVVAVALPDVFDFFLGH